MDFLKLVHKKQRKFNYKIAIVPTILLLLLLAIFVWPSRESRPLRAYLPNNTVFYYHWLNEDDINLVLVDNAVAEGHLFYLINNSDLELSQIKEILWWKSKDYSSEDNYLLRFSNLSKEQIKNLENSIPDYSFESLEDDILLATIDEAGVKILSDEPNSYFGLENYSDGLNLYWQLGYSPEFLEDSLVFLTSIFKEGDIFVNGQPLDNGKVSWSIFNKYSGDIIEPVSFNSTVVLKDFDVAAGFSQYFASPWGEFISKNISSVIFSELPFNILDSAAQNDNLFSDVVLLQADEHWLLVAKENWQDRTLDFSNNFVVKEVKSLLPDGTLYKELVADEPETINHQFNGQEFWQKGDLFGYSFNGDYYLSDRQYFIEQIIDSQSTLSKISNCPQPAGVNDFIMLKVEELPKSILKEYLVSKEISYFTAFSFIDGENQGIRLCF